MHKLCLVFFLHLILFLPLAHLNADANNRSNSKQDEYVQAYREEARANRPSLSYIIFKPAIDFFKQAYDFLLGFIIYLKEKIESIFEALKIKLQSL